MGNQCLLLLFQIFLMAHDESMFIIIIFFLPVMRDLRGKIFYSGNIQKKKELSLFLFMIWASMQ